MRSEQITPRAAIVAIVFAACTGDAPPRVEASAPAGVAGAGGGGPGGAGGLGGAGAQQPGAAGSVGGYVVGGDGGGGRAGAIEGGRAGAGGTAGAAGAPANACAAAEIDTPCASDPNWAAGCCGLSGVLFDTSLGCFRPSHLLFCSGACGIGEITACYEITRADGHKDYLSTSTLRGVAPEMAAAGIRLVGGECAALPPVPQCD